MEHFFQFLQNREIGGTMRLNLTTQLKLFKRGKMIQDTLARYHQQGQMDNDVFVHGLRNRTFERLSNPSNFEDKYKVYLIHKSIKLNGIVTDIIVYYSKDDENMRGVSLVPERTLEGYTLTVLDLMSRLQAFVYHPESDVGKFVVIQGADTLYNRFGEVDIYIMRPNNTSTVILPKALASNFKIFTYMNEVFDTLDKSYMKSVVDCRTLWKEVTAKNVPTASDEILPKKVPDFLNEYITDFEKSIQLSSMDNLTSFDCFNPNMV